MELDMVMRPTPPAGLRCTPYRMNEGAALVLRPIELPFREGWLCANAPSAQKLHFGWQNKVLVYSRRPCFVHLAGVGY